MEAWRADVFNQTRSRPADDASSVASRRPPSSVHSYATARDSAPAASGVKVADFNDAYRQINRDIDASLGKWKRNAARLLTGAGTFATVGGAIAMGLAAPAALTGLLTGIGVPHGAALAILGVGVGLAGFAISVLAGAMLRSLTRSAVKSHREFEGKIIVLKVIKAHLEATKEAKGKLDAGDATLLKNTRKLLRKVDGDFGPSLRKQAGNALAAPFTFFTGLAKLAKKDEVDANGNVVRRVEKRFGGGDQVARLGVLQGIGAQGGHGSKAQDRSLAQVWLDQLLAPPASIHQL